MSALAALGTFPVVADGEAVAAFRAATDCAADCAVPVTFPMRWLMQPDVRQAIMSLLPEANLVPVHESQSFDYVEALRVDASYRLLLSGARSREPARLTVQAAIADAAGVELARLDTVLRLIEIPTTIPPADASAVPA